MPIKLPGYNSGITKDLKVNHEYGYVYSLINLFIWNQNIIAFMHNAFFSFIKKKHAFNYIHSYLMTIKQYVIQV
jgi:hypothetical protein